MPYQVPPSDRRARCAASWAARAPAPSAAHPTRPVGRGASTGQACSLLLRTQHVTPRVCVSAGAPGSRRGRGQGGRRPPAHPRADSTHHHSAQALARPAAQRSAPQRRDARRSASTAGARVRAERPHLACAPLQQAARHLRRVAAPHHPPAGARRLAGPPVRAHRHARGPAERVQARGRHHHPPPPVRPLPAALPPQRAWGPCGGPSRRSP